MRVIKKKLIREIQTEPEQITETNEQRANTGEDNQVREVREDNVCTDNNCREYNNKDIDEMIDTDNENYKELKQKWEKYLEKYKSLHLDHREYETRVNRTISEENMMSINSIVGRYLYQALKENGLSMWDLNVVYYSAAVTVLCQVF